MLYYYYTNVNNERTERKHEQHISFLNNSLCTWDTYATRGVPERRKEKKERRREKKETIRVSQRRGNDTRHAIPNELPATQQHRIN